MLQRGATTLALVALLGAAACSGSPSSPTNTLPPLSELRQTDHFTFRLAPGDSVDPVRQEAFHQWAVRELGVAVPATITYNKYLSREHMHQIAGRTNTNAFAEPERFAVHTIWSWDNHECVHVYTALIGRPTDFFNEGIAVAFQTDPLAGSLQARWSGEPLPFIAARFKSQLTLIPIDEIVETDAFRRRDPNVTYPEAGAFVGFVIDRYGLERMKTFFRIGTRGDSRDLIRQNFARTWGVSLDEVIGEWLAALH